MVTRTLAIAAAFTMLTPLALAQQSNLPAPVESSQLSELDGWSVSALSRSDGALAPDLWAHSEPAFVAAVFDRLPATYNSPAMQTLARRVLFSGGEAPRGAPSSMCAGASKPSARWARPMSWRCWRRARGRR